MRKRYNIFIISRLYLKRYYNFLIKETKIRKSSDAYTLFIYSVKKLYGLESVEYCRAIDKYGDGCVKYLEATPDTPQNRKKLSFEDRVRIVSVCEGYAQATGILSYKYIKNGRLEEG